jgi:hypothetical protein
MAGLLSITFRGPFVFSIQSNTVDVYAPKCDGHLAGISWTDGESPIEGLHKGGGNHTYSITGSGVTSNTGSIAQSGLGKIPAVSSGSPQTQFAYFHILVPRPKIIYRVNADTVEIVQSSAGPQGATDSYATSLRFYYDWVVGSSVLLSPPVYPFPPTAANPAPPPITITPPGGAPLPEYGDIEIQYDGPGSGDPDHLDAIACFDQIAQLAGVSWWLNYYNPSGGGAQLRTGSDCKAVPLVFGI